ncbi:MAG: divergent PAP2 family protein [Bacteroidia bacterium]
MTLLNTGYEVLLGALIANVGAQVAKTFVNAIKLRKWDSSMLLSTGGMPSSHSATVTALATALGIIDGWHSTTFAIGLWLALIVMYDAQGVRLAASVQATILNQILKELFSLHPTLKGKKLKELLGHTPMQVVMGALLGIGIAFAFHHYLEIKGL